MALAEDHRVRRAVIPIDLPYDDGQPQRVKGGGMELPANIATLVLCLILAMGFYLAGGLIPALLFLGASAKSTSSAVQD